MLEQTSLNQKIQVLTYLSGAEIASVQDVGLERTFHAGFQNGVNDIQGSSISLAKSVSHGELEVLSLSWLNLHELIDP
jgi:hypothetical protein